MKAKQLNWLFGAAVLTLTVIMIIGKTPIENKHLSNPVLDNIFARTSVREYTHEKVSHELLNTIVRAGMAAPTAMGREPWAFVVVDDRSMLDSLAGALPYAKMLNQATAAIVVCGDADKAAMDVDEMYWIQDCSAASENILLAATSLGLGTVWTGVAPRKDRMETVAKILNLPSHLLPLNVIAVGYATKTPTPKNKYKPENIHWNGF